MSQEVVVDASLIIKRVVPERMSDNVKMLLAQWKEAEVALIAPVFFMGEVDSILRQKVVSRKELTLAQAHLCWKQLQEIPVEFVDVVNLRQRIWEISIELQQAHVYDSVYLALAEARECEFWTADERLFNATKKRFPFVRSLINFNP
ncbi:MAG: type II toxin-antitoxin system VapC family toxin [Candidatus Poribacteria bacterium]|nr:type II toxin-antitoxin system VapC family toxin [Candidatus Poribacteria bacterium]